jgi:hypothetical protein
MEIESSARTSGGGFSPVDLAGLLGFHAGIENCAET